MQLFVTFNGTEYTIDIKRSHTKLVVEICEEVLQSEHKQQGSIPTPCCSYGIFIGDDRVLSYDLIPDSGLLNEMRVNMRKVVRDRSYRSTYSCPFCTQMTSKRAYEIELYRMLDLFWIDEIREKKLMAGAIAFRKQRLQKVIDSCDEWAEARQKNWTAVKADLSIEYAKSSRAIKLAKLWKVIQIIREDY